MFSSLRSRLLLSYAAVIFTILLVVAVALVPILNVPSQVNLEQGAARLARLGRQIPTALRQGATAETVPDILRQLAAQEEARILILTGYNTVFFDTSANSTPPNNTINLESISRRQMPHWPSSVPADWRANFSQFVDGQGQQWLGLRQEFGSPNQPLTLLLAVPAPTLRENVARFLAEPLLRAGGVAVLLAFLLAYFINRSVAAPLQRVATAASAIATGDYSQRVAPSGPREVQTLATSFNQMVEQVQQSQQAQRDFVANVSHDLKTPLTAVQGWSQALLDGTVTTPTQQTRAANIIHAESARMARLVNQLLDLARLEAGQVTLNPTRLDLNEVVQNVQAAMLPRAEAQGVALTAELPPTPVLATADGDRVTQILTNLLDNALKNTPAGGRVSIQLATAAPDQVLLRVADTGRGIPAEDLPRIFERFYQVEKSRARVVDNNGRASIGLGLAIVRQLVEAHGGRITAESELGQGSQFTVWLKAFVIS